MTNIFEYHNNFEKYRHVKSILQYGDPSKCANPVFSVIMPVYGNPKYFIHSFNSVVNQDANFAFEVIVVDNTPLDDQKSEILKLIERANLTNVFYYRNEENIGMTGNWNRGIELSRSDLITFCHDDDMLYPNCLSKLWDVHQKHTNKFVIPDNSLIDENVTYPLEKVSKYNGKEKEIVNLGKIDIFMGNPTNGVGCLFYRKHLLEFGGYNEEYYPSADNALHIKYFFKYGAIFYRRKLYCYRVTSNNTSNRVYKSFISNGLMYCEFMARHMRMPGFIKDLFTHAYLTKSTIEAQRLWEKKDTPTIEPTIGDRLVFRYLTYRNIIKNKKILWK